jgi:hypothetical protein
MDPDPGGSKICGSESPTLHSTLIKSKETQGKTLACFSPVLIGLWEEGLLRGLLNILYWRYSLQIKVNLAFFEVLLAAKTLISPPEVTCSL